MAEATLTAQNTFTDWVPVRGPNKRISLYITGTFSGTLTLQARKPGAADALIADVESHTGHALRNTDEIVGSFDFRIGFKTGDYTSGSAFVEINSNAAD